MVRTERQVLFESINDQDYLLMIPYHKAITDAALHTISKSFEGKVTVEDISQDIITLSGRDLTQPQLRDLEMDLEFLLRNPHTPLKNICSRLNNYHPNNDTQQKLLQAAFRFKDGISPDISRGIYVTGSTGVGKTHVAIGLTKEIMFTSTGTNYVVEYVQGDDHDRLVNLERRLENANIDNRVILILDDVNSPFALGWRVTKRAVLKMYDRGGMLFVTSNKPYEHMLDHGFATHPDERPRYESRATSILEFLQVEGEDYRLRKS